MAQFNCKNWREAKEYALRYPELIRIIMIQNKSLLEYDPMHSIELSATPSKEEIIPIIERIEGKYFPPSILTRSNELYEKELTNPQWINKSNEIKARDFHICQRCYNSIVLNDISELKQYLDNPNDLETIKALFPYNPTNEDIKNCLQININEKLTVYESIAYKNLYFYTLIKHYPKSNIYSAIYQSHNQTINFPSIDYKTIFISHKEKEADFNKLYWGEYHVTNCYVLNYKKKPKKLYWQYCEFGDTNDKLILSHCGDLEGHFYSKEYRGIGILSRNQYSIVFPLYSLNTRSQLEVHHKHYRKKDGIYKKPWEYSNDELMVLCHECHQEVHKKPIPIIYE